MKLFGHNRRGRPECATRARKRNGPTKAERRLQRRIESYNAAIRALRSGKIGPDPSSYHRPGSLQSS